MLLRGFSSLALLALFATSVQAGWSRSALESLAAKEAEKTGVPVPIMKGVIEKESNWNPNAKNSGSGAGGIMQFMEKTAEGRGMTVNFFRDDRMNPAIAIPHGAQYLALMYKRFPEARAGLERWRFALAAYNTGRGNLNKAIKRAGHGGDVNLRWTDVADESGGQPYVKAILGESGPMTGKAAKYGSYGGGGGGASITTSSSASSSRSDKRTTTSSSTTTTATSTSRGSKCVAEGGRCKVVRGSGGSIFFEAYRSCGSGVVPVRGLCGSSTSVCCVPGRNKCIADHAGSGGHCVSASRVGCRFGTTHSGKCPGSSDIKCCVPPFGAVRGAISSVLGFDSK